MSTIIIHIIVNDKTITYGDDLPTFDYQISFDDGIDHITNGDITVGNNSVYVENVQHNYDPTQPYKIYIDETVFTINDTNNTYLFDTNNTYGILTVNKATLTVKANNITKNYDGQLISSSDCAVTISGYVFNDNSNNTILSGTHTFSGTSFNNKNVTRNNTYHSINVSGDYSNDKYDFLYVSGKLYINPISLSLQVNDYTKTYDGIEFNTYVCTVDGNNPINSTYYVNNETFTDLIGTINYGGSCVNAVSVKINNDNTVGYYTITATGLTDNNYDITFAPGKLFINKKTLIISANSITKTYNGLTLLSTDFSVNYSGFISGENSSNLSGTLSFNNECLNAVDYKENGYQIIPDGYTSNNYNIVNDPGLLTINKAVLTLITKDMRDFTNGNPQFTYGVTIDTLDYSQYYTITGFVNDSERTSVIISGKPTFTVFNYDGKLNVGSYNTELFGIGTLLSDNYSFAINNGHRDYYPQIIITKASLTLSPKQPNHSYTYGDSINYTDLYDVSGYVLNDTFNNTSLIRQHPIILFGTSEYTTGSKVNIGTYNLSLDTNTFGLVDNNYNYTIINPTTLPQVTINKSSLSIISVLAPLSVIYGDSNIVTNIFKQAKINGLKYNDDATTLVNDMNELSKAIYVAQLNSESTYIAGDIVAKYIKFNYIDSNNILQNIDSTTKNGSYTSITIDKSEYNANLFNYTFSNMVINGSPILYNVLINKKPVYVRPVVTLSNPSTIISYGTTMNASQIRALWEVYGFINGHTQETELNPTTNPQVVLRKNPYSNKDFYYTGQIVECNDVNDNNYSLYVNSAGLSTKTESNYYVAGSNNERMRPFVVKRINFEDVGLTFNSWTSFLPEIIYGVGLTPFQLNILSPKDPYLNKNVGTVTFVGKEIKTGDIDTTNFILNGHPNIGVYTLTAVLTIDNPSYNFDTKTARNNSYTLEILKNIPLISHWNPAPIIKGSPLTSAELSAYTNVSNEQSAIIYCDNNGKVLQIGDIVTNDMEIIEKVNDYTNTNFYPNYTFRKQKITTL